MPKSNTASRASSAADSTLEDLKALLAEAEKALSSAAGDGSGEIDALRGRLREALDEGRAGARRAVAYAKEQAAHADEAVHAHPYVAIGIAAGLGLIAGALVTRCASQR
jgi:ElaB protein